MTQYLVIAGGKCFVRDWTLPTGAFRQRYRLSVGGRLFARIGFEMPVEDVKAVRFIPDGADEPPLPPGGEDISESDLERAAALWDELMPEYAGLLKSPISGKRGAEDAH